MKSCSTLVEDFPFSIDMIEKCLGAMQMEYVGGIESGEFDTPLKFDMFAPSY